MRLFLAIQNKQGRFIGFLCGSPIDIGRGVAQQAKKGNKPLGETFKGTKNDVKEVITNGYR